MKLDATRLNRIHKLADRHIEEQNFGSMAWRVSQNDVVVDERCHGWFDYEQQRPLDMAGIYRIYSMTKPVVAVRALQLIESGLLSLDAPVCRWVPEFERAKVLGSDGKHHALQRHITIEDLMTHRAGLSYDFLANCTIADMYREARFAEDGERSLSDLVDAIATMPLAYQPGERWYYSYACDVLAEVLVRVTGQSLGEQLREHVFQPLAMENTGFSVPSDKVKNLVCMYGQKALGEVPDRDAITQELTPLNVDAAYPIEASANFVRGGHGLYSTLDDYSRFTHVLMDGCSADGQRLLSDAMLEMSWANRLSSAQIPIGISGVAYAGYGWNLTGRVMTDLGQALNLTVEGEGGWSGAAATQFWVDRANKISGVVMTQYLGSCLNLGGTVMAIAYGAS